MNTVHPLPEGDPNYSKQNLHPLPPGRPLSSGKVIAPEPARLANCSRRTISQA
jgi:hypothetical protein